MSKYILPLLVISLLCSCTSSYDDHKEREYATVYSSAYSGEILGRDFHILPNKQSLMDILEDIRSAKKRIWIQLYTWTEKSTLEAVLDAKNRGVDVRVILEGNVYKTPRINDPFFDILKKADIPVFFADNRRYTFTHAKFWLIDDVFCISTGNWSYSTFTKNRDFIFCGENDSIMKNLEEIFLSDASKKKPHFKNGLDNRLAISPLNMRQFTHKYLEESTKSLYIYNQTISDEQIIKILENQYKRGRDVRVCTNSLPNTGALLGTTFPIYHSKKPYLHAKISLIDDNYMIIGSMNFTENAIDYNREIAIKIEKNRKYYSQVKNLFLKECIPY